MSATVTIDMSQWRKAAAELYATSSRTLEDFTNGQALKVAIEAVRNTRFVQPERITYELGHIATEIKTLGKGRKTHRLRKSRKESSYIFHPNSLAIRILGKRFREKGSFGIKGRTIQEAAEALVKARRRSAHFIRAGWIPARRQLWAIVKQKPIQTGKSEMGAKLYGKPKGYARRAIFRWSKAIFSEIGNMALMTVSKRSPDRQSNPMPVAQAGLRKALDIAAADMIETLSKRLQPDLRKVSSHG